MDMGNEILTVNILNPVVEGQEFPLRVQIVETTEPTEWQRANITTAAKRKGKDGEFILHNGEYIFTRSSIVFNEPVDTYLMLIQHLYRNLLFRKLMLQQER